MPYEESESALLDRAASFAEFPTLSGLDSETLRQITVSDGIDFATALLYDRVIKLGSNASFSKRIDCLRTLDAPSEENRLAAETVIGIVPAAFYLEKPHSGADGRVVREAANLIGLRSELVPLHSTGTLKKNSRVLIEWLKKHAGRAVILVSLCKGSADVKFALSNPELAAHFSSVLAWVNICGTLYGSPIAQWLLARKPREFAAWLFLKCNGHSLEFVREIVPSPCGPLSAPLRLPPNLRLISVIGFPLRRHLSNGFMRRCHAILSPSGPNDGGMLLADACRLPGTIYPVWGADHYLRPDDRARQLIADLLKSVSCQLARQDSVRNRETPCKVV